MVIERDGGIPDSEPDPDTSELWLVDPIDAAELDDRLGGFPQVAGVVVLSQYHRRHAAALARHFNVSVYLPEAIAGLRREIEAATEVIGHRLLHTELEVISVRSWLGWWEAALYDPISRTFVVAESIVAHAAGTGSGERVAVSRMSDFGRPGAHSRTVPWSVSFYATAGRRSRVGLPH